MNDYKRLAARLSWIYGKGSLCIQKVDQILEGVDRGPKKVENWLGVSKPAISISPGRREVRWGP